MEYRHVIHTFPPVINQHSKVLILGSAPSVVSARQGFYYMHPHNRFWQVMQAVTGLPFVVSDIEKRKQLLLESGIALYDVIYECDVVGSADSALKNVVPAPIPELLTPNVKRIICNGAASYKLLLKYYPQLSPVAVQLPSTSPANAAFSLQRLTELWREQMIF